MEMYKTNKIMKKYPTILKKRGSYVRLVGGKVGVATWINRLVEFVCWLSTF